MFTVRGPKHALILIN